MTNANKAITRFFEFIVTPLAHRSHSWCSRGSI